MLSSKILFLVMLICDISGQLYLAYSCHGVNVYAYAVGVGVYRIVRKGRFYFSSAYRANKMF